VTQDFDLLNLHRFGIRLAKKAGLKNGCGGYQTAHRLRLNKSFRADLACTSL